MMSAFSFDTHHLNSKVQLQHCHTINLDSIKLPNLGLTESTFHIPQEGKQRYVSNLLSSPNDFGSREKFKLPPFKIKDRSALLTELGFIIISQLLFGIYTAVFSTDFPGWFAPMKMETLSGPTVYHSLFLCLFWICSRWWSKSLDRDVFFFRLKDAFDSTWQEWIAVANLYIISSLIYGTINHITVTGIEVPLLSGAIAVLSARVVYYGIDIKA